MIKLSRNNIKKAQAGFTLVELMIVVAIIGILASIAIPNYQKYQAKARTSEGKIQLAAAYIAEKSFFIEYSSYTGCLAAAGYAPDIGSSVNPARRYYATGISGSAATAGPAGNMDPFTSVWAGNPTCADKGATDGTPGGTATVPNGSFFSASVGFQTAAVASSANLPVTAATWTGFTVGAAGLINPDPTGPADQWYINEGKVITQFQVGY